MACTVCAARGINHDEIVNRCKNSIYYTALYLCQWERMQGSILHKAQCDWLQRNIKSGIHEILWMAARDHLKTSTLAAVVLWGWQNNPELRVLLVHASGKQSAKLISVLQRVVLSDTMRHFRPDLVPDTARVVWRSTEFTIPRQGNYQESSIEARGVDSTVVGGHYNWILFDDVIDENSANSPSETKHVIEFFESSPALYDSAHNQLNLTVGTFWHGGYYENMIERNLFKTLILGAECDERFRNFMAEMDLLVPENMKDGDPIWPAEFPKERLQRIAKIMGPVKYARQMLNIPTTHEMQTFKKEYIRYYNWHEDGTSALIGEERLPFRQGVLRACVDPAGGENEQSDPSAIVVICWFEKRGIGLVLQAWSERVDPNRLIKQIFKMNEQWSRFGPVQWGIEQAALQSTFRRFTQNEMHRRGVYFSLKPLGIHNRSKVTRAIEGLQPFLANGQIFFLRNQGELIHELLNFRVIGNRLIGKSPNLVDALAMHTDFWRTNFEEYQKEHENMDMDEDDERWSPPPVIHSPYGLGRDN